MIFEALGVALRMLPLSQRSSLSICDAWEIGIAAAVVSLRSGIGIELVRLTNAQNNIWAVWVPFVNRNLTMLTMVRQSLARNQVKVLTKMKSVNWNAMAVC
jgi:hypothetical protein